MKKLMIWVLTSLIGGGAFAVANAQETLEVRFFNGLAKTIVDAKAARAEKCDVFKCGEWARRSSELVPLASHDTAKVLRVLASPEDTPTEAGSVVCRWDIKITLESDNEGEGEEHVFRDFNFCTPKGSSFVSFERAQFGVIALHSYDVSPDTHRVTVIPSETVTKSLVIVIKEVQ